MSSNVFTLKNLARAARGALFYAACNVNWLPDVFKDFGHLWGFNYFFFKLSYPLVSFLLY